MKIIGIVAEWNPFHNGHQHLIDTIRTREDEAVIVACMSGAFCQRGEVACLDKWTRTEMALAAGVDVVLELPQVFATSSLEDFARGGVATLLSFAPLDALYCGSESGDEAALEKAAAFLRAHTEAYNAYIHAQTSVGASFAQASQDYLFANGISFGAEKACPNDRLALGYRLALPPHIPIHLAYRTNSHHATEASGTFMSGSALRTLLPHHLGKARAYLPPTSVAIIESACQKGWPTVDETMLLSALKIAMVGTTPQSLSERLGIVDGWSNRFYEAVLAATSLEALLSLTQTRHYSRARIARLILKLLSPLEAAPDTIPYVRVLGFSPRGRALLKGAATPRILNTAKDMKALAPAAQAMLKDDIRRQNLADLLTHRRLNRDYLEKPRIL